MNFLVFKAGRNSKPGSKDYEPIHRVADGTAPRVQVAVTAALERFAERGISRDRIEELLRSGALDQLDLHIPWRELQMLLARGVSEQLIRTIARAADAASAETARTLKAALGFQPTLSFDGSNPRLLRWMEHNTARLVREVTDESRDAIRQTITRTMREELRPIDVFRSIKRNVTLTAQQAVAAQNVYHRSFNEGASADEAMREAAFYADRALAYRAERIARTETMLAANQGQQEGWQQAADEGLFHRDEAEIEWVVTPDDKLCPTCEAMDGVTRDLNGTWTVRVRNNKGAVISTKRVTNPTQAHPLCRCAQRLKLKGVS